MRSSPAYAGLVLELPATTLAGRAAGVLVLLAGVAGTGLLARHGVVPAGVAVLPLLTATLVLAIQAWLWTRSRSIRLRLERTLDGGLVLHGAGATPVAATLGPRTRRIGPSVFLDLRFAIGGRRRRIGRWLTRFDLPGEVLRRWTVVLPACGHAARS